MEEGKYMNKTLFMRKSKKGNHVFAFDRDGILGEGVELLLINISDLKRLLNGEVQWCKVSALNAKDKENESER